MLPSEQPRNQGMRHSCVQWEQEHDQSHGSGWDSDNYTTLEEDPHERAYAIALSASIAANKSLFDSQTPLAASAMELYARAMALEGQGCLNEALVYYRRAFKLDADIDAKYRQCGPPKDDRAPTQNGEDHCLAKPQVHSQAHSAGTRGASINGHRDEKETHLSALVHPNSEQDTKRDSALVAKNTTIEALPDEILVRIFCQLAVRSVSSVLTCSLVCRRFLQATRSPTLWRFACEHVFRAPGMASDQPGLSQAQMVQSLYGNSWIRMFIERPRIRYDGVYIAVCQYVRQGESETAWTPPVHRVTYYRYLRFFPDGSVLKYLSIVTPVQVARLLSANFSRRQVLRGRFQMAGGQVSIALSDQRRPKYKFNMALSVESTHRGGNNKLVWQHYESVDQHGNETMYDLKLMQPFLFSVVKSFSES